MGLKKKTQLIIVVPLLVLVFWGTQFEQGILYKSSNTAVLAAVVFRCSDFSMPKQHITNHPTTHSVE